MDSVIILSNYLRALSPRVVHNKQRGVRVQPRRRLRLRSVLFRSVNLRNEEQNLALQEPSTQDEPSVEMHGE